MAINNTKVKDLLDTGMDKDLFDDSEESLPRQGYFSGDDEVDFDYASESEIDLVETIQGKAGPQKASRIEAEDTERASSSSETSDNIVWAYLKDMGQVSLLTPDEELHISQRIEEA